MNVYENDISELLSSIKKDLKSIKFDSFVATSLEEILILPEVASLFDAQFLVWRGKCLSSSHHTRLGAGTLGSQWIYLTHVDNPITEDQIKEDVHQLWLAYGSAYGTQYVGSYYIDLQKFVP